MRRTNVPPATTSLLALILAILWLGCASGLEPTQFTNPNFDFAFVEKVAVLPLENHSQDRQAAVRATRLLITELLATGAVDVVEPGQVQAALDRLPGGVRTAPNNEQITELGESLEVQAIIFGSVSQSENIRSGTVSIPVVTLDVHMVETETGVAVWAATHTEKGGGLSAKLLGTGAEPISATTRRCARVIVENPVK
jgi:TolB-like protein